MPDVFDFLVVLGVGASSNCDDLEAFDKRLVDNKQRQMWIAGFGVMDKIDVGYPMMKFTELNGWEVFSTRSNNNLIIQ